jgi:hypothetical protein
MGLTAEQFAELVDSLSLSAEPSSREKRRAPRIGHHGAMQITLCANRPAPAGRVPAADEAPPHAPDRTQVQVVNLSSRGICITYNQPLPNGRQFVVHILGQDQRQIHILCTVVHCRQIGSRHKIGAEFTCVVSPQAAAQAVYEESQSLRIQQSILE